MKILFSHPGVGIFVQQAARALYESNLLESYYTTFYYNPNSFIQKVLSTIIGNKILNVMSRRMVDEIPLDLVRGIPQYELLRVLTSKMDNKGIITDKLHELSINKFDKWVSRNITNQTDAVYCYEYNSLNTLKTAKKNGLYTIYEIPSPEHNYVHNLLMKEIEEFPELNTDYYKYTMDLLNQRTGKRHAEFELADLVIVNSEFTRQSFDSSGLDTSKIVIVPLGCPTNANNIEYEYKTDKLRVIWAGTFSIRKGAHYLIKSMKELGNTNIELDIYGEVELPERLLQNIKNINFMGSIPRHKLLADFCKYDLLIFPTLCDGFGMVITEALSKGLPVITTDKAGASDFIKNGKNGFIIKSHESDSIVEKLLWCINNKEYVISMRQTALNTAAKWQWSDYRNKLAGVIKDKFYVN